jgi:hypothetical protein
LNPARTPEQGNIDLACEMLGPICAGLVLQWAGGATGFALVGVANLLSFGLEASGTSAA